MVIPAVPSDYSPSPFRILFLIPRYDNRVQFGVCNAGYLVYFKRAHVVLNPDRTTLNVLDVCFRVLF